MADEFYDLFNQLFYSTDVWGFLGIAVVLGIFLLLVTKIKGSFVIFCPILMLMAVDYLQRADVTPHFVWHFIISVIGLFMLLSIGIQGLRKND